MSVRFTEEADAQLRDILSWLDARSPSAAAGLASRVDEIVRLLDGFPAAGQRRYGRDIRALSLGRFPCLLFYRIVGPDVEVLSIRHTSRRPPLDPELK